MAETVSRFAKIGAAVFAVVFASPAALQAQQGGPARVGLLRSSEPPAANLAAFRQGMRDRGQIEGKSYVLIPGWLKPGEKRGKDLELAKRLAALDVDLIVTVGSRMTGAAMRAAPNTPIVMASTAYASRHVKSLAAPGGSVTGMSAEGADALSFRTGSGYPTGQRERMMEAALRAGLPTVPTSTRMVKLGGLIAVGISRTWLFRRAAAYVDLFLKGAKPGDLPVERPKSFQVVLNLKTARALGFSIPNTMLLRADEVVE